MKKTFFLLLVSAYLLNGCHSGSSVKQAITTAPAPMIDTSQKNAALPPKDTAIRDGQVIKHYPNGVIKEKSYYKDGRRHGECQSFYQDGKLWSDDYFSDGLSDGPSIIYYENGQKRYEGNFVKGKPSGTWKYWDEKGKLLRTMNYDNKKGKPSA